MKQVFPFGSSTYLEMSVSTRDTVLGLLERIIQKYMNDPRTDKSLLEFPFMPAGYFFFIIFFFKKYFLSI